MYRTLHDIYPSLACRQFLEGLQQLERECGYGENGIPQLREVSAFLKGENAVVTVECLSNEKNVLYNSTILILFT